MLADEFVCAHNPGVARFDVAEESYGEAATDVRHPGDALDTRPATEGAAVQEQVVADGAAIGAAEGVERERRRRGCDAATGRGG